MLLSTTVVEICDERILTNGKTIYTSLEGENPGGSIKDYMIFGELQSLLMNQKVRVGDTISELSMGGTARSLAYYGRKLGLKCVLFVPNSLSETDIQTLKSEGAQVHLVEPGTAQEEYTSFCAKNKVHSFGQMTKTSLSQHYKLLGAQINRAVGTISKIIGTVGTGQSLIGLKDALVPAPMAITAEPAIQGQILGVRNIELESYGKDDIVKLNSFNKRIILTSFQGYKPSTLTTSVGEIVFSNSFRLVLAAAQKVLAQPGRESIFLIGASNRRRSR